MTDRDAPHAYPFFTNRDCPYYPCHDGIVEGQFNCLFCYCPLYALGPACGGDFSYTENGRKDCTHCTRLHRGDGGTELVKRSYDRLAALAARRTAVVVASFGTTHRASRHVTIGAIEDDIREAFPECEVIRAFTAQGVIEEIRRREGRSIMGVAEALETCLDEGITRVVVQPTHLVPGVEFDMARRVLEEYRSRFESVALGEPLLSSEADRRRVGMALLKAMRGYDDARSALCFVGHGTSARANEIYGQMQGVLDGLAPGKCFLTTVEARPSFDDTVAQIAAAGYSRAVLRPLMVVAGEHAENDMADAGNSASLAAKCRAAGIDVVSVVEGLGQLVDIGDIYVAHVHDALERLG